MVKAPALIAMEKRLLLLMCALTSVYHPFIRLSVGDRVVGALVDLAIDVSMRSALRLVCVTHR